MECIVYSHVDSMDPSTERARTNRYLKNKGLKAKKSIEDGANIKLHWHERAIGQLIKEAKKGDIIVVHDAAALACSTSQILEIFNLASTRQIHIYFVKYEQQFVNDSSVIDTREFIRLISRIESDFISRRTTRQPTAKCLR